AGRIWIVISRATSDCHSAAEPSTSITAPVVSEARNVMIATTATSALPAIELRGTIGVTTRGKLPGGGRAGAVMSVSYCASLMRLLVDVHPPLVQHEAARVVLVHQRDIVRRDHDRGARLVELDEQAQQPLRERRIDVAGRLVGEEELRPRDHGARD